MLLARRVCVLPQSFPVQALGKHRDASDDAAPWRCQPLEFGDGMRDAVPRDAVSLELSMYDVTATVSSLDLDAHQHKMR
jgi:hypothetical protein